MIIRVIYKTNYTQVPNHLINDDRVSGDCLAVITYLCGKPNNWVVSVHDIRRRFNWGKDRWQKVSKELRELNLLALVREGSGTELVLDLTAELPVDNPVDNQCIRKPGFPTVGKPDSQEIRPLINKDIYKNKDSLKTNNNYGQTSVDNSEQLSTEDLPSSRVSVEEKRETIKNFRTLIKQMSTK